MKLFINDKPWTPFILIFILVFLIIGVLGFSFYCLGDKDFDWTGIYTESIGMLLDVLFLGVIWAVFEYYRGKRLETRRYNEDIDDFRRWKSCLPLSAIDKQGFELSCVQQSKRENCYIQWGRAISHYWPAGCRGYVWR